MMCLYFYTIWMLLAMKKINMKAAANFMLFRKILKDVFDLFCLKSEPFSARFLLIVLLV